MTADIGIVIMLVACDLSAEIGREDIGFVNIGKFNLGKYQPFILTVELINFDNVFPIVYKIASLLDTFRAEGKQFASIIERYLLLPFEATYTIR